jgi:hypothetical protein
VRSEQARTSWFSKAASVVLIVVVSLAIADAVLSPTPPSTRPDFIDTIFASRAVVAAIRIAIVFAALFLVLSAAALITRRQWLARVGPVEVERVEVLGADNGDLEERVKEANRTIEDLEERVAYTQQLVDRETR